MTDPALLGACPRPGRRLVDAYLLVLALWMCARAAQLSLTCDESTTLLSHVPAKWWRIFAHLRPIASNNHLLNTLGIKTVLFVLPEREWVVRLPALLGFVLYATAARRWVLTGTSSAVRAVAGIVLLTANPFLLDLLVLARGYALALGLWAWAAVLAHEWSTAGRRDLLRPAASAVLAGLSLCANLSFVFPVAALGLLTGAGVLRGGWRGRTLLAFALPWAATAGGIAYLYRPEVMARIESSLQTWGGRHGVWADTVPSLVAASLWRDADERWVTAGTVLVALVLACASAAALRAEWRTRSVGRLGQIAVLTWLVIAGMTARHLVSGARFPLDRAAVVLLPLLCALLLAAWESAGRLRAAPTAVVALVVLADLCAYRFAWTHSWSFDAPARQAMQAMAELTRGRPEGSVRLAVWRPVWSAIEYYRLRLGVAAIAPTQPDPPEPGADLYYYMGADAGQVVGLGLTIERHFPVGDTYLARPAPAPER